MAGYYLYSLDADVFKQLTNAPTVEQASVLADFILPELEDYLEEFEDESAADIWPRDRGGLADFIRKRLAAADWYSDLSLDSAHLWDNVILALDDEPGEAIGIDFQCENDGYLYWDAAEIATRQGASMMAEPKFGGSAFRYFGKPSNDYGVYPMYSLYTPEETQKLLAQLESVGPHFLTLPQGEESERDQFFEGLLGPVQQIVANGRVLWVQTDT